MKLEKYVIVVIELFLLIVMTISISFAAFDNIFYKRKINTKATITEIYNEGSNKLTITDSYPLSDIKGINSNRSENVLNFTLDINMDKNHFIEYILYLTKGYNSTINDKDVNIYLEKSLDNINYYKVMDISPYKTNNIFGNFKINKNNMILEDSKEYSNKTYYYRLKIWPKLNSYKTNKIKYFTVSVNMKAKDYLKS